MLFPTPMNPSLLILLTAVSLAAADAPKGPPLKEADAKPPDQNRVTITVKGDKRIIESNGIPDHKVAATPTPSPNRSIGSRCQSAPRYAKARRAE